MGACWDKKAKIVVAGRRIKEKKKKKIICKAE